MNIAGRVPIEMEIGGFLRGKNQSLHDHIVLENITEHNASQLFVSFKAALEKIRRRQRHLGLKEINLSDFKSITTNLTASKPSRIRMGNHSPPKMTFFDTCHS
jgi:hypothetical protein